MKIAAFLIGIVIVLASCNNNEVTDTSELTVSETMDVQISDLYQQTGFTDRVIELGKIVSYDLDQIIHFTNEGSEPLILSKIYAENEWLEVRSFTYEIAPGARGKIRLKLSKDLPQGTYLDALFMSSDHNPANEVRLELKYEITDQLVIGGLFIEEKDRVNVRMFPSLDATVLFGLEKGDAVDCVDAMQKDYVKEFDSDLWYYVDYNGRKGWVLSALTEFEKVDTVAMLTENDL